MAGWKPKDLKTKSFANVQRLFDKAMKMVNTFVDMDTYLVKESSKKAEAETAQESSSKRAGEVLEQESSKKQKVDDDKGPKELKQCMEIISDDEDDVTIEATPLSTKSPTIVDYKIYKKGKKSYFQIIRADDTYFDETRFGGVTMLSLEHFDVVTRDCDAVSTYCMPSHDHLRVKLQSCPVSSQIESKSRVVNGMMIGVDGCPVVFNGDVSTTDDSNSNEEMRANGVD
ncbi:hypothetical protein Tco_0841920 [Tanacetum coccineum]|uniref:Uncharacterized protein n=1 Tax=Tanacetum coccineum TaxID=301880 RepID=A0ABQ5B1M2_9ASTR